MKEEKQLQAERSKVCVRMERNASEQGCCSKKRGASNEGSETQMSNHRDVG